MFATGVVDMVLIDGQFDKPPVEVTIQKLNWKTLRRASETQAKQAMSTAKDVGPDLMRMFSEADKMVGNDDPKMKLPKKDDPETRYRAYDRDVVLTSGVKSWTAPISVKDGLDDLDEPTADKIFRAIIDLSVPAPEVATAQRGEGF